MQRIDRNTMEAGVESIFKMLAQRVDDNQMQLVRNAYELAAEAHKEQKRKTGEPYIIHPIAVARIVAEELELGANQDAMAVSHDLGIKNAMNFEATVCGTVAMSQKLTSSRSRWFDRIAENDVCADEDFFGE